VKLRGPLADSYPGAVVLVVCALLPYLILSTSITAITPLIEKDVGISEHALQLTSGFANAAYAVGAVIAVQFAVHLRGRRLLVFYALLFVIGSAAAAWAPVPGFFIAGRVIQGLATALMLIAAVPPLVIGWPANKIKITSVVMNLGVFGAVAVGPVVGGVVAGAEGWRAFFWIVTGIGGMALLMSLLTFEDDPPTDRSAPVDLTAIVLAAAGCAAAFFGSANLSDHRMMSVIVLVPLLCGLALIALLFVVEYRKRNPLIPVRKLTSTFPTAGIVVAISGGAASVAIIELVLTALEAKGTDPTHAAMLFWPEFGGALLAAIVFGQLFRTRWTPVVAFVGLITLAGGAAVLTGVSRGGEELVVVGSGLVGLGVGLSVAPALFVSGFSLPSMQIARVFASIELLRGVAAFMTGPILLHLAKTTGGNPAVGTRTALWVCMGIALGGALVSLYIMVLGRARLQTPDVEPWLEGTDTAIHSPPLAAGLRDVEGGGLGAAREPQPAR
jgi:MFS family permease